MCPNAARPVRLLLWLAWLATALPALALNPLPAGFAEKVQAGWRPASCALLRSPNMPQAIVRQWVRERAGERVSVLFIVPSPWFPDPHQAEAQAIARSLDLDGDIVPLSDPRRADKQDAEAMSLLRHLLATRRYDAIALTGAGLTALPADCAERIVELVRQDGVGFVHSIPGAAPDGPADLTALDALLPAPVEPRVKTRQAVPAETPHPLTAGSDFTTLRWVCDVDAAATADAAVLLRSERPDRVLAAAAVRGKGRVVSLNGSLEEMVYGRPFCPPVAAPFLPEEETGKYCRWLQGTECADQFYAWLGRALLWAANREPPVAIRGASVSADGRTVEVRLVNGSAAERPCVVRVLLRSPYNTVTRTAEAVCNLAAGESRTVPIALHSTGYAGRHQLDVLLLDREGRTWDWWCSALDRPSGLSVVLAPDFALHLPREVVKLPLKIEVVAAGQPFEARTELFDLDGRLLWDQRSGAEPMVDLGWTGITTTLANLRVTVTTGGESAEVRDQLFIRQDPRWDAFHIMAYDGYYEEPFGFAVRAAVLRRMGHDTLLASWPSPHRLRVDSETGMRVVPNNLAPFCGYKPEGMKYVTAWLRRFSPPLYELQDEPELQYTAASEAPFDSDAELERLRTFLKGKYGTLDALNAAWGTEAAARRAAGPGFEVLATLPAEARFKRDLGDVGVAQGWFAPELDEADWTGIKTGAAWEPQGRDYDGYAWYRIRFVLPEATRGRVLRLAFGGVDEEAWVYLNGKALGERSTASTGKPVEELWDKSFELPLPGGLEPGRENLLVVRVHDQAAAGGIYQPITLVAPSQRAAAAQARGYADWGEVQRFRWFEVADSGNWAPWFDSRRELDRSFVEKFGACADALHTLEPDRVASVNFRGVETFSGVDLRAFTRRLGAASLYTDFVRDRESAASIGFLELGAGWAAPTMSCLGYSAPPLTVLQGQRVAHEAWDAVRHGVKMIAWFLPADFLNQDLTPNAEGRVIETVNRTLQAGPGPVAAATEPLREGVFVYTPRTMFYADTLACLQRRLKESPGAKPADLKGLGPFEDQIPNGFVPHLRALGYQFEFGDEDDLTAARLKAQRVVLLSHVVCLGERELQLLSDFVRGGGCVIAEAGTGRRDGAGRLYADTPQSSRRWFGVRRPTPNPSPAVEPDGVVADGARKVDWIPAALGTGYQSGKVFFLDFPVPNTVQGYQVVRRALERAGVRPTFALRDNRLPDGPPVMVDLYGVSFSISNGLRASLAARRLGPVTYLYLTGDRPGGPAPFSIALPGKRHVYELVSDKSLGVQSELRGTIAYGQARVFALSPVAVTTFTARAGSRSYRLGQQVRVRFSLGAGAGDRVVRLDYRGSDKGARPAVPRTLVLKGGTGEVRIVLPLNAAPGPASIRAKDLASGRECAAAFEITKG
ncbi:MAG: hypothetical protein HYU66_10225 [Armatimonadetes bacterium]|nr:hypothetical protein [Armatimonadota bacterium]